MTATEDEQDSILYGCCDKHCRSVYRKHKFVRDVDCDIAAKFYLLTTFLEIEDTAENESRLIPKAEELLQHCKVASICEHTFAEEYRNPEYFQETFFSAKYVRECAENTERILKMLRK